MQNLLNILKSEIPVKEKNVTFEEYLTKASLTEILLYMNTHKFMMFVSEDKLHFSYSVNFLPTHRGWGEANEFWISHLNYAQNMELFNYNRMYNHHNNIIDTELCDAYKSVLTYRNYGDNINMHVDIISDKFNVTDLPDKLGFFISDERFEEAFVQLIVKILKKYPADYNGHDRKHVTTVLCNMYALGNHLAFETEYFKLLLLSAAIHDLGIFAKGGNKDNHHIKSAQMVFEIPELLEYLNNDIESINCIVNCCLFHRANLADHFDSHLNSYHLHICDHEYEYEDLIKRVIKFNFHEHRNFHMVAGAYVSMLNEQDDIFINGVNSCIDFINKKYSKNGYRKYSFTFENMPNYCSLIREQKAKIADTEQLKKDVILLSKQYLCMKN